MQNNRVTDSNRQILVFGEPKHCQHYLELLTSNGWQPTIVHAKDEFESLATLQRYKVILVVFSDGFGSDDSGLANFGPSDIDFVGLASTNVFSKWFAIVPDNDWFNEHPDFLFGHVFYDYHREPILKNYFLASLGHAYGMTRLQTEQLQKLTEETENQEIIGDSTATQELKSSIYQMAQSNATVLITGESGTGKELAARNIHKLSSRATKPFIVFNCSAIPESRFYALLFGHEKGQAPNEHTMGKIEAAKGGTLFIDEIGDLPLSLQADLLHFIETHQLSNPANNTTKTVNCRVILATNIDLEKAVSNKKFRKDLYHRINVLRLELKPLRMRRDDIAPLAEQFLKQLPESKASFSQSCYSAMRLYNWPGNVRELMNRIQRAAILASSNVISEADLDLPIFHNLAPETLKSARASAEKRIIQESLEYHNYNCSKTAITLNISRTSLYRLLDKHKIDH